MIMVSVMKRVMTWLDSLDWTILLVIAVLLGLAPFSPVPHLFEKVDMLLQGNLVKPMDIFDLFMHGTPALLVMLKAVRQFIIKA